MGTGEPPSTGPLLPRWQGCRTIAVPEESKEESLDSTKGSGAQRSKELREQFNSTAILKLQIGQRLLHDPLAVVTIEQQQVDVAFVGAKGAT